MLTLNSKLATIGTSIFATMSKLAEENDAINLSQGFPDFNTYDDLIDLVHYYMKQGHNQYAPMPGVFRLRQKIITKIEQLYNARYNVDSEITITAGATQALFTAITAFVSEGDEVIVFEPAYDSYVPAIMLSGGKPCFIPLTAPEFSIDWKTVEKNITPRTRMIIINSPHNPTGSILTKDDYKELDRITRGTNILILSDEVYEHIVFDNHTHSSISSFPKLKERSLVVSSFGKTYHTTGWKLGYCVAPKKLMQEFRKTHQFVVFAVNTPVQMAVADYMDKPEKYLELSDFYQQKRDYFLDLIKDSRFSYVPANGTYFQLLDYSRISKENDVPFAEKLVKEFHLASIPISVFYNNAPKQQWLRFCFAKSEETLHAAAQILNSI